MRDATVRGWTGVAVAVLCVTGFYSVLVARRVEQHGVRWFLHLGHEFLTAGSSSRVLRPTLGWQSRVGYDGQYYFAVAADPRHARDYIGGNSGIVYSRVFYPAASRVAAGGSVAALPYSMLAINLFALLLGTASLAVWLRNRGSPAWPAAVFGLFPGLVFTVIRDLTEPLAFGLTAAAMLVCEGRSTRRLVGAALLFALALLTRETVAPFALAAAATLVFARPGRRDWRRGLLFAVGSFAPLVLWRIGVAAAIHQSTQEVGGAGWGIPLHGILSYRPFDAQHRLIVLTVVLPALALGAGALPLLRERAARIPALLLVVNVLLYVVFLPATVDVDYGAAGRAAIGVVLAAAYCVPYWRLDLRHRLRVPIAAAVALSLTIVWFLVVARHYGLDGMDLISS
jgi:hypothetical protein